jgi:regulator of sirC expression with transglutaminase-like and TPR domain
MAMSAPSPVRRAFADQARRSDARIDLARAALLIAQEEYPALDVDAYLARLDAIAARVQARLDLRTEAAERAAPATMIAMLNAILFAEMGFHGATRDYYDPRSSFLNEALDRRTGLPITLSVIYIEVAARLGLSLAGVGLPGHFIVKYEGPAGAGRGAQRGAELFIDPYHAGALLTRAECGAWFRKLYGPDFTFSGEYLAPLTRRQILARMLRNLKGAYLRRRDYARAVAVVDRLLLLHPDALWELKDRGLLYYRLGAFTPALADLRAYRRKEPEAEDKGLIEYHIELCQRSLMITN